MSANIKCYSEAQLYLLYDAISAKFSARPSSVQSKQDSNVMLLKVRVEQLAYL